jgi:hypothetical protein
MQNQKKIKIPKHLEKYLPKYVILYGEPHLILGASGDYELKIEIPATDYFLNMFQEFYNLKAKPEPQEMFQILENDIKNFMKKLKEDSAFLKNQLTIPKN